MFTVSIAKKLMQLIKSYLFNTTDGPTFAESNSTEYVVVGNSISLNCEVSETNPDLTDFTFTTTATDDGNVVCNKDNMEITISNATLNDAGTYTCTANNGKAKQALNFEVLVGGEYF